MGNLLRILKRDTLRLLKAPAAMVVVVALMVLPSIYTWYNVVAFWDPYEATGNLMQTTLLGLGSILFLKVQVAEPWLFMTCFWVAGLVFAFIIYTLVVSFGNLGKAIAVLLLIVQVTACGGSYPLPLLPDFVQALSPWMPASHVVDALRAAMFGLCQNDFWVSMGKLLAFVVPFLLLGLALRKPLEGFMRFYMGKVEESKMME